MDVFEEAKRQLGEMGKPDATIQRATITTFLDERITTQFFGVHADVKRILENSFLTETPNDSGDDDGVIQAAASRILVHILAEMNRKNTPQTADGQTHVGKALIDKMKRLLSSEEWETSFADGIQNVKTFSDPSDYCLVMAALEAFSTIDPNAGFDTIDINPETKTILIPEPVMEAIRIRTKAR